MIMTRPPSSDLILENASVITTNSKDSVSHTTLDLVGKTEDAKIMAEDVELSVKIHRWRNVSAFSLDRP
jgi:hypothetical protein